VDAADDHDVTATAETIRAELRTLRAALTQIEQAVDRLPQRKVKSHRGERHRPERYYRVLVSVYERGGRHGIAVDALGAIGGEHGYDRRGLGGFFAGTRAPLQQVDGRVRLTAEGLRLVDRYLHELAS